MFRFGKKRMDEGGVLDNSRMSAAAGRLSALAAQDPEAYADLVMERVRDIVEYASHQREQARHVVPDRLDNMAERLTDMNRCLGRYAETFTGENQLQVRESMTAVKDAIVEIRMMSAIRPSAQDWRSTGNSGSNSQAASSGKGRGDRKNLAPASTSASFL